MRLAWIDDGESIRLIPLAPDALRALRGAGKGEGLLERLLTERDADRRREG